MSRRQGSRRRPRYYYYIVNCLVASTTEECTNYSYSYTQTEYLKDQLLPVHFRAEEMLSTWSHLIKVRSLKEDPAIRVRMSTTYKGR